MPSNRDPSINGLSALAGITDEVPYRLMVAAADFAVFMLDLQGLVTTWNVGAERMKGYSASEIIGRHFSIFYPQESVRDGLPEHELAVAATAGRYVDEGWRVRRDGSRFWASVILTAERQLDGTLVGFVRVTRDLTERLLAEERFRESEEKTARVAAECATAHAYLTNVYNAATFVSIIATDPQGMITAFNRGAELMLGYTAEEIVGKHTPEIFHLPEEIERQGAALSSILNRPIHGFEVFTSCIGLKAFEQMDWTYVHKDGHHLTVVLYLSTVRDDGRPIGSLGVAKDLTERRRMEKEIATARDHLDSALESTSDSVMTISRDWTLLYGNQNALHILPDFKVGKKYWDCFPETLSTPIAQHLRTAMEERSGVKFDNYYAPYDKHFKVQIFPTEDGLSVFFSDMTMEKKLRDQLERERWLRDKRIEALSHMAGGLAHEISNPLAIIMGRANDLKVLAQKQAEIPSADVLKACDSIERTSDRAVRILRGLRGFAHEGSKDPMALASISEIVEQCMEMQEARFERHTVEMRLDIQPDMPLIVCREIQVGQIVTNLLNNAFDAIVQMKCLEAGCPERWISLAAAAAEDHVIVDVTDSGPGIQEAFKPHLMEPFFTTKELGAGMGVGLSLSRAIAQDHGGSLTLRSGTEHTCFRLVLPVRPATDEGTRQQDGEAPHSA